MAFAYKRYSTGSYCHEHWATTGYPLLSSKFNVWVYESNLFTELVQLYNCTSGVCREVIYVFEVPPNSAVTGFTAQVGDNNIKAVIKSKTEAATIYTQTTATATNQAYKLEQVTNDVFQISLGNVNPNTVFTVTVTYAQSIISDTLDDTIRLAVPLTYGVTRIGSSPIIPAGWNGLGVPGATANNAAVEVTVKISMDSALSLLRSPTHPETKTDIGYDYDASRKTPRDRAALAKDGGENRNLGYAHWSSATFPDKDFVLTWGSAQVDDAKAFVQSRTDSNGKTTYAFQLSRVSPVDFIGADGRDFIFLLDGTMEPNKDINTVHNAYDEMLNYLPGRPRVTVYRFWNQAQALVARTTLDTSNISTVRSATTAGHIYSAGSRDIAASIKQALDGRDPSGTEWNLILVSDCQDWNVTGVVKNIHDAVTHASEVQKKLLRVFVFAIGPRASVDMAESIARAGLGGVVYAIDSTADDIPLKAKRLIKTVGKLPIQAAEVDWSRAITEEQTTRPARGGWGAKNDDDTGLGLRDKQDSIPVPATDKTPRPRNLTWSIRSTWNAIIRGTLTNTLRVRLKYRVPGETQDRVETFKVTNLGHYTPGDVDLHVLSAKALAQAAQDELNVTTSSSDKYDLEAAILRYGLTYGFVTTQTSFIATTTGVGEKIQAIEFNNRSVGLTGVNTNLAILKAQHKISTASAASSDLVSSDFSAANFRASSVAAPTARFLNSSVQSNTFARASAVDTISRTDIDAVKDRNEPKEVTIDSLADSQTAQGGLPPNLIARDIFGGQLPALPDSIANLVGDDYQKSELWATLLAIAYSKAKFAVTRKRDEVEEKGKKFFVTTLDCCFNLSEVERYNLLSEALLDAEDAIP